MSLPLDKQINYNIVVVSLNKRTNAFTHNDLHALKHLKISDDTGVLHGA